MGLGPSSPRGAEAVAARMKTKEAGFSKVKLHTQVDIITKKGGTLEGGLGGAVGAFDFELASMGLIGLIGGQVVNTVLPVSSSLGLHNHSRIQPEMGADQGSFLLLGYRVATSGGSQGPRWREWAGQRLENLARTWGYQPGGQGSQAVVDPGGFSAAESLYVVTPTEKIFRSCQALRCRLSGASRFFPHTRSVQRSFP